MNPKIDWFFEKIGPWQKEVQKLRTMVLGLPLEEEMKWGKPCYLLEGKNIVLIGKFKEYCSLLFFKGALMADPEKILVAPGAVQAGRQIRFTSVAEIGRMQAVIKRYITQAIEVEKAGLKVQLKKHSDYVMPEELQKKMDTTPRFKKAFLALTPGRQRGDMIYIAAPKQGKTREARVEKSIQPILDGKGVFD
jgi:uncharacterized protein YdeI (YjbR/CyaY-like superfamily)